MNRFQVFMLALLASMSITGVKAQIGYQISLLNTATGEARANEQVMVEVKLSNNTGEVFYNETKSATTNDFGVLSLSIGNADTFKDVDLSKMPFFIEVSANGVSIGKSQILSVPVAETAKRIAPAIDKSVILGTWKQIEDTYRPYTYTFNDDGKGILNRDNSRESFAYEIEGKIIYLHFYERIADGHLFIFHSLRFYHGLLEDDFGRYAKQ